MPTIAAAVGSIAVPRDAAVLAGAVLPRSSSCSRINAEEEEKKMTKIIILTHNLRLMAHNLLILTDI